MRIVTLEEHVNRPSAKDYMGWQSEPVRAKLLPSVDQRIADMDAAGISVQVLSALLPAPRPDDAAEALAPVQALDESAIPIVRAVNEELHELVCVHPDRFFAFATLPVGRPAAAAAELERAVGELGFVGTMIAGTIGDRFLDDPEFTPILEAAAGLDVPIYLHPAPPPKRVADIYYQGAFPPRVGQMLGNAGFAWHFETSLHIVRMIIGGVFDRLPGLKVIIGHLGEGLSFHLHRLDRLVYPLADLPKPISRYLTENIWYTTSGYFFNDQFALTRAMFGEDRIMFSVDYPFADPREGIEWFNQLDVPAGVREKMACKTADQLLRLPTGNDPRH
ncbi:amidohydrolase family protein [Pseudonocardia eucalypti]|uniref:Amidohydrolase family protein n=1 Tax=Pseudonocardia eucalypti TaxID=648755 RepID=A0ABP9QK55_9PSEU|nr:putative TIM-barrel fold metal-dependent hydrolase [Pseudonocardia eucalypti]